jgi:membrane protease YdiL (CAAX protease family)
MIPDDNNPLLPESVLEGSVCAPDESPDPQTHAAATTSPVLVQPEAPPSFLQYPEDLRVPWGWADLAWFFVVAVLSLIFTTLLMTIGLSLFRMHPGYIQDSAGEKSLLVILAQALLFAVLLGYLFVLVRVRFERPFWQTIGWHHLQTGAIPRRIVYLSLVLGGFSLSLLVQLASAALQPKSKLPIQEYFQDPRSALLLILMSILLAPLAEETIFRGYIYPVLARSFGVGTGVVITGTLFGLLHAPQLWGGWGQIVLLIGVGIIFTAARAISRTVVASYILHVSYNSFIGITMLVGSHGFRHFPVGQ